VPVPPTGGATRAQAGAAAGGSWWSTAVGYEVYLRSFADSDGDGVGDLPGVRAHLDHLVWLGVDFLWITPFYPSPMADHGYDVSDHCGVDPRYGDEADVVALIRDAHALGLRVVIDLVPNHTSDQHPWFAASRDPADPHRGYYLWRDGTPDGGPPNNWVSYFGGPAWTRDPASGQWWGHLFLPEQPDLDWANEAVRQEFDDIIQRWLDRGVDGFRVDVAQGLSKDPSFADNPRHADRPAGDGPRAAFDAYEHRFDIGQPENLEIFERWRKLVDPFDGVLLGEVYLDPEAVGRYLDGQGLQLAFSFAFVDLPWKADAVRSALVDTLANLGSGACWTQTSHDEPRPPTRFGGGARGRARALAVTTLLAGMPGPLVLYQGEELGLEDGAVPAADAVDPMGGRDGCRTPMVWASEPGWGFTTGTPWLPFGDRVPADTAELQRADDRSPLHRHRALLATRRHIDPAAEVRWLGDDLVVTYRRGAHVVAACVADEPSAVDVGAHQWTIEFSTDPARPVGEPSTGPLELASAEAVIVAMAPSPVLP